MAPVTRTPKQFELELLRQLERYVRKYMTVDGDVTELERGIKSTLRSLTRVRKAP